MTATRKWTFGAVAAALLLVLGGWFLLISPKRAEVADLQAQTDSQVDANAQAQTDLEVLQEQNKNLPQMQAQLRELETKIPETQDLALYIRELQEMSRSAGVTLTAMVPTSPVTLGGDGDPEMLTPDALAGLNVDITLSGPFEGIQKFTNDLENSDRYTLATGLTITDGQEGTDTGTESAAGELTATVNARIYLVPQTDPNAVATTPAPAPAP